MLAAATALVACGGTTAPTPLVSHRSPEVTTPTSNPSGVSWSISAIDAVFSQSCFCTDYQVTVFVQSVTVTGDWTVAWSLRLALVDPAGSSDVQVPGSHAQVDPGCNNDGVGTTRAVMDALRFGLPGDKDSSFTWFHPDPTVSANDQPPGVYRCNHSLQGAHGHEGIVTATVTHGALRCTAIYWGTKSGMSTDGDEPGPPTCKKT